MAKLSIVISAYNEAKRIALCLDSVQFADEIIFIDNSSQDETAKIARKYTKKIYKKPNNPMLNVNKNFGFTKATGDWILSLDADEQITQELAQEIRSKIDIGEGTINGFWIPRKNMIFGKWIQHGLWWPDYQLRLFRTGKGKFEEKHVHEMLIVDGQTEKLSEPMTHDNYSSISQFLYKLDRIYTESEVENFLSAGKKVTGMDALNFPIRDFLKTFFAQEGYKDGLHGLVLSLLQAFYSFIVFAKIWEKQGFQEYNSPNFLIELGNRSKIFFEEMKYWYLTAFISGSHNILQKLLCKIQRKIIAGKIHAQ